VLLVRERPCGRLLRRHGLARLRKVVTSDDGSAYGYHSDAPALRLDRICKSYGRSFYP